MNTIAVLVDTLLVRVKTVHIGLNILYSHSVLDSRKIIDEVNKMLQEVKIVSLETTLKDFTKPALKDHVQRIRICELDSPCDNKVRVSSCFVDCAIL